jgi:lipopolysaccharide/colanic/teichoic acid biosynthesis glycosyltransferase/nucleoside-diphosphate-sugar epimerase
MNAAAYGQRRRMHRRDAISASVGRVADSLDPLQIAMPEGIYTRGGKRLLDIVFSVVALTLLAPFLFLIACAVRLTSRGPAFFRQERVGRHGKPFTIVKIRTMFSGSKLHGSSVTSAGDPRITPLGRLLRRRKLDELPQLWNVLRGEMSLVGPRPELPLYVARYTPQQRAVLDLRPGITGSDALAYREEEKLLAAAGDPPRCYEDVILPHKLAISLKYLERVTALNDCKILLSTVNSLIHASADIPVRLRSTRDDQLAELLDREPVTIDLSAARSFIEARSVLVTGAAGSIGSKLSEQIISLNPAKLVCLDHDRLGIKRLQGSLVGHAHSERVVFVAADVGDRRAIRECLAANKIECIFHAAAHKHLPALESQAAEAVSNNIFGLDVLLRAADEERCEAFVLISSDKAVNPSSVMGATKRVGELMLASRPERRMRCVAVRFGNVLGSSGSVVPILEEQLRMGVPLTITDSESRRYFMASAEAASLALEAFAIGRHGEILVLEMGAPIKIVDLARKMARLSRPHNGQPEFHFIGLRPGEKLEEELFYPHEAVEPTANARIVRAAGMCPSASQLRLGLSKLREALNSGDAARIRTALKEIVPEYTLPGPSDIQEPVAETPLAIVQATRDESN